MVRKIVEVVMCILCFVIQTTVFQFLEIASVSPNLLVVLVAAIGFMRGKKEGMFIGFVSGMVIDLYFSNILGFYALVYTLIGYFNGIFRKEFLPEDIKLPIILIVISDFLVNLVVYLFLFLFRGDFNFLYYLFNLIIPELVYTLMVSIVLYIIILKVNQKVEQYEKRNASKFG